MRLEIARILPRPLLLATAVIFEPSLRTQNNLHDEDETSRPQWLFGRGSLLPSFCPDQKERDAA